MQAIFPLSIQPKTMLESLYVALEVTDDSKGLPTESQLMGGPLKTLPYTCMPPSAEAHR